MQCQDSIQVVIRVRPHSCQSLAGSEFLTYSERQIRLGRNSFAFDRIFNVDSQQQDIFSHVGMKLVHHSLEGYNSCVFAYGQTGSGKTHTMVGTGDGLIQRSIEQLFLRINAAAAVDYIVTCSYFEIYNEQLVDLLDQSSKKLTVREDMKKGVFVENLAQEPVADVLMAVSLLNQGIRNRHIGETQMNRQSSRSHAVFTLNIQSKQVLNGCANLRSSKLHFVDLAGSERQKSTACMGERLKEASNINKSLTTLGMVINSLSGEKHRVHIPFRDSKLTFVLRDSLGGNSKTFIIATVSSMPNSFQESLSTLKFAQRAKMVKLSAHINEESLSMNAEVLKAEIRRLKDELFRIRHELQEEKTRNSSPAQIQKNHYSEIILSSYNRGVSEINEKINSLLELIPAVTSESSLVERLAKQLTGGSEDPSEKNVLVEYLSNNSQMLKNINDNLNSFVSLRQEIRAKASVEKLRLEELRTPHKLDREQIEQFSNAKNQELCEIKKTVLELRNELTEKDRCIGGLNRMLDELKQSFGTSNEQNRYLKDFYEAKQSQLLLKLENHSVGPSIMNHDYSEDIRTLLNENKHILQESTSTIGKLKTDLHVKSHEIEMLSRNLMMAKKSNNQLVVDREAIEGQLKLLQMDYDLLRTDSLSLEERLETYTRGENYTQKSMEQYFSERKTMEQKHNEEISCLREQTELSLAEINSKLETACQANTQLSSDIEVLTETVEFKNNNIARLEQQIREKEEELRRIRSDFEAATTQQRASSSMEIEAIGQQLAGQQQENELLRRNIELSQQAIFRKQAELELLREAHTREIAELQQSKSELQYALAESKRLEQEYSRQLDHYRLTLIAQQQQVQALKCAYVSEKSLLEQSIHDHKHREAQQLAKVTRHYERELEERRAEAVELSEQVALLKGSNQNYVSSIKSLQNVIQEAKSLLAKEMSAWKQTMHELSHANDTMQSSFNEVVKQNGSIKAELAATWNIVESFKTENARLDSAAKSLSQKMSQAEESSNSKTKLVEELKHELEQTQDQLHKQKAHRESKYVALQKKHQELKDRHEKELHQLAKSIEKEREAGRNEAKTQLKQLEESKAKLERELQKVVDWKNLIESEFQAVNFENQRHIDELTKESAYAKQQLAETLILSKDERARHQEAVSIKDAAIAKLQTQLAAATSQVRDAQESKASEIRELTAKITELTDRMAQVRKEYTDRENSLRAQAMNVEQELRSRIGKLQCELSGMKESCLSIQDSESMKTRLNEVLISNYKLKNKHGAKEEQENPSRLEAKISYYEQKFNLMKIEYTNSVETVRKLKQREMEIKEQNCQLEEKLRAAQVELEMNTKQEIEAKLIEQNEQLRAMVAHSKPKEDIGRVTRREAKEGKQNSVQVQNLKKDKETLSETLQTIRSKMLLVLSGMSEVIGEQPQQEMLKKEISNNLRERDESKQIIRTLSLFEDMLKKKEGSLFRNIRKEEKLKSQNSFIVKENMYLKQRLQQLESNGVEEGQSSHKKVKRA